MNDFGIKNMDQVAPVASSYRGTLKVSEHVLIETYKNWKAQFLGGKKQLGPRRPVLAVRLVV